MRLNCEWFWQVDMVGLPAGVRFDPTDQELIEHLEAKVKEGGSRAHPLIDQFIHAIQGEEGICYTHPENLPGVTKDGLSKHFFHRPAKAYTTGTRKRRKVLAEPSDVDGLHRSSSSSTSRKGSAPAAETRWHKTGRTRPVMVRGQHKGCKKILVLYTNFGKKRKSEKTNWVMHQYHLGELEDEKEGELIVSKVFYQTQTRSAAAAPAAAVAPVDYQRKMSEYAAAEPPPAAMQDVLHVDGRVAGAASAAKVQRQPQPVQQQLLPKHGDVQQFSSVPTKKRPHAVT
ncbi:hypothetical protein GUJ93_ZPchr0005g14388 [Zizania palustris]|uniref:NAC domain-containing protein n=1 Tax=Zizania palustris TaxID=103762 RepID=A0A8J5SFH3_ZIZPA|nr:hypothetical protein GUJ93_ZPchr0005g14388 [Zizania palustris]